MVTSKTVPSPFMRYNPKVICIINMQVGTQPLPDSTLPCLYIFTILGHFVAQDTYTFHTKQRRCTGSGSDPLLTSVCSLGQADWQTGGLYKAPGVKYIIEKLWLQSSAFLETSSETERKCCRSRCHCNSSCSAGWEACYQDKRRMITRISLN